MVMLISMVVAEECPAKEWLSSSGDTCVLMPEFPGRIRKSVVGDRQTSSRLQAYLIAISWGRLAIGCLWSPDAEERQKAPRIPPFCYLTVCAVGRHALYPLFLPLLCLFPFSLAFPLQLSGSMTCTVLVIGVRMRRGLSLYFEF